MNPEELLAQIRTVAGDKARANGLDLLNAILKRNAHLTAGDAREVMAVGLQALEMSGRVKLPIGRHLWDYSARAPIPLWISVVQETVDVSDWSHRTHPWHPALGFVADLKFLPNTADVRALDRWLRAMPDDEPFVPVKERSWEIFGEEKKLEALAATKLFDNGRLTLERLRCYIVEHVPVHRVFPGGAPVLIISENEAGFDSLCRAAPEFGSFRAVVFGNGLAIEKAVTFLTRLVAEQQVTECLYVGDVDEVGLAIPCRLNSAVWRASASRISIKPWFPAYSRMLRGADVQRSSEPAEDAWLPPALNANAKALVAAGKRVAQESCGWKQIRELIRTR